MQPIFSYQYCLAYNSVLEIQVLIYK